MKKNNRTVYLKLPFVFEVSKLQEELQSLMKHHWIPHFNTGGYDGEWKAISLYTKSGEASNIYVPMSGDHTSIETDVLKKSLYLKQVMDTFKCPIISARLLRLGVGAEIKPHRDFELGYEDGCFRLHIPIESNRQVKFVLDGELLTMLPGECWYTNVNYIHSVSNFGQTDRVHLVIDGQRNAWSDQLFFSLAPEESFQPEPPKEESLETKARMIEELKRMNNPNNSALILKLEADLKAK